MTSPTTPTILILGLSGAGKSSFINAAAGPGDDVAEVGHRLDSCTKEIKSYRVGDVVLVDTPGFNDTWRADVMFMKYLLSWLAEQNERGMQLAGIIYLHEISQARLESAKDSHAMLSKFVPKDEIRNVVLATTKWSDDPKSFASEEKREAQLSRTPLGVILSGQKTMVRFLNTRESAWDIITLILKNEPVNGEYVQKKLAEHIDKLPPPRKDVGSGFVSMLFGRLFGHSAKASGFLTP